MVVVVVDGDDDPGEVGAAAAAAAAVAARHGHHVGRARLPGGTEISFYKTAMGIDNIFAHSTISEQCITMNVCNDTL